MQYSKNTYWENSGKYQVRNDEIQKLIPASGECEEPSLELFRVTTNAYYDNYNNGGCNPGRYEDLLPHLNKWKKEIKKLAPFTDAEFDELLEWVEKAAQEDRAFYMLRYPPTGKDLRILQLFERLSDATVLMAEQYVLA